MSLAYRIVSWQAGLALVAAALLWAWDERHAIGALAAGVVCVVPNGYFAWRASHERSASRLLGAGVAKFIATVVLMALGFATLQLSALGFFGTFIALQIVHVAGATRTATAGS